MGLAALNEAGLRDLTPPSLSFTSLREIRECAAPSCTVRFLILPSATRAGCSDECTTALKSRQKSGESNPRWKGDDASSGSIHFYLARAFPKKDKCERCGKRGKTDYAFLRHPHPHSRERKDYIEACRSCHLRMDYKNGHRDLDARLRREAVARMEEEGRDAAQDDSAV